MADHILTKGFKVTTGKAYQRGQVVKLTGAWTVDVATAATDNIIGVCTEDVDQVKVDYGKVIIGVDVIGITRCIASEAIAAGAAVTATTGGKIATAPTDGQRQLGIAMGAAAADGDEIDVLLTPGVSASIPV